MKRVKLPSQKCQREDDFDTKGKCKQFKGKLKSRILMCVNAFPGKQDRNIFQKNPQNNGLFYY